MTMMFLVLRIVISVCILVAFTSSIFMQRNSNQMWHYNINQLLTRFMKNTKPRSQVHLIIDRRVIATLSEQILDGCRKLHPVILNDRENNLTYCETSKCHKMHFIVGIFKTPEDVRVDLWRKFYGEAWNADTFIAIWISDPTNIENIEKLLETFWQHDSLDVVVIIFDKLKNSTKVYSYNPFIIRKGDSRSGIFEISSNEDIFPDKLKNLYGYPIPISLYEHQPHASLNNFSELIDGADVNYCKSLAEWMNFTIDLKTAPFDFSSYNVKLTNGSNYGVVADIVTNRSDFLGNSMHWESSNWVDVEFAYPRWRSRIVIMIPRNKPRPGISRLFESGSGITMALICGALTLLFIILTVKGDSNAMLKTLSLMLYQTFGKIGSRNSERIFCITWIYWSLILISIFQSKLVHDIAAPPYHNDLNSLHALYKSNLTLMTKRWEQRILNTSYISIKNRLSEKAVINVNATKCVIEMMTHKNVACTVDSSHADFTIGEVKKATFRKRQLHKKIIISKNIHVMKEPLFYYWRTYVVKKNFVYLRNLNKLAGRLVEFGIMEKWIRDDMGKNFQGNWVDNSAESLDLEKLHNIFFILFCGHAIATIVFLLEFACHKFKYKSNGETN